MKKYVWRERFMYAILFAAAAAALLAGCATPKYEDGTRAGFVSTCPCNADNCGKPAWK